MLILAKTHVSYNQFHKIKALVVKFIIGAVLYYCSEKLKKSLLLTQPKQALRKFVTAVRSTFEVPQ